MIHTSSVLSSLYFNDGDPFTIDFWYKPLAIIGGCSVGHEWFNGIFYFGIANDNGSCLYFATYKGLFGINAGNVNVGRWYHVAMAKNIDNKLFCFINGILVGQLQCPRYSLRLYDIDLNRQRDGSNRGSFVIDNFRISDVARWTSNFDPPKWQGIMIYHNPLPFILTHVPTKTKMRSVSDSNRGIWFCRPPTKPLIQPTASRIYNFVFDQTTSLTKFLLN